MSVKYAFIAGQEGRYPRSRMFVWAGVSSSGYYEWRDRPISATARRRAVLVEAIKAVFADSDATYGYRRVHAVLARSGLPAGLELVRQLMREHDLEPCQPKPYRPSTTIAADSAGVPDLVRRDFTADAPGVKLVGDITYIRTWQGWLYLATVIDCATKACIGYAMAEHMRTELVITALDNAARTYDIHGAIFHSDRGTQGGFNRSSQHLDHGGMRWDAARSRCRRRQQVRGDSGRRIERCGRRCVRLAGLSRHGRCSGRSGG